MPSRTRRLIAGTGLAAGLLVGSIAPATALPGTPNDDHCAKIERFEERALARIDRFEGLIERFEARIERIESRAEGRPAHAKPAERRLERMNAKVERFENRIARITARYDAIADHCGVDPLFPADEDPGTNEPETDAPVDA
jgi:hypothetical protein